MVQLNFPPIPERICKNCGKKESLHKAKTHNCCFGRPPWYQFFNDQFFEAKEPKQKKEKK